MKIIILSLVVTAFTACESQIKALVSDRKGGSPLDALTSTAYAASNSMPACDAKRESQLSYAVEESSFFVCQGGSWVKITIQGQKGEKGDKGESTLTSSIAQGASAPANSIYVADSGNVGIGTTTTNSRLSILGGGTIVSSLDIAAGGCGTSNTAQLAGSPDLSGARVGDSFFDEAGKQFVLTGIDNAAKTLSFSGTCVENGATTVASIYRHALYIYGGWVGINTQTPTSGLTLNDTELHIHSAYANGINLFTHSDTSWRAPQFLWSRSRGTQATPAAVLSGDILNYQTVTPYDGAAYSIGAQMYYRATENWSSTNRGTSYTLAIVPTGSTVLTTRLYIDGTGRMAVNHGSPQAGLDVAANSIRIQTARTPASNAACSTGEIAWDTGFVYVCTSSNTWKRAALSSY